MDQNWFFRWIWRFNAVVLALVFVTAAVGLVLPFLTWQLRPVVEQAVDAAKPPEQRPSKYRLTLESAQVGRSEIVMVLQQPPTAERGLGSFKGGDYGPTVINYLFVDPATGKHRWLFPTHKQLITSTEYLTEVPKTNTPMLMRGPMIAAQYDVVPGVDRVADDSKYQFFLSRPNGAELTKVFDELDEPATAIQLDPETIVVSYRLKGRTKLARISLKDFKVVMETELPELPK